MIKTKHASCYTQSSLIHSQSLVESEKSKVKKKKKKLEAHFGLYLPVCMLVTC